MASFDLMSDGSMDHTIAAFDRAPVRMGMWAVIGVVITVMSAAIAFDLPLFGNRWREPSLVLRVIALFGTIYFGAVTAIFIRTMRAPNPILEVTRSGIRDRRMSPDIVHWSEVVKFDPREYYAGEWIMIDLSAEAGRRIKRSLLQRLIAFINVAFGFSSFWITATGLNGSFKDIVSAIEKGFAEAKGKVPVATKAE